MEGSCSCGCGSGHMKYKGIKKIIVGALILVNAFLWPQWLGIDGWVAFGGILLIICGVMKMLYLCKSSCCSGSSCCEAPKKKKR